MKIRKKQKLTKEWFIKLQNIICNSAEQLEKEYGSNIKFKKNKWKYGEFRTVDGVEISPGEWIVAYKEDIIVGAREWNGEPVDVPVMGYDGYLGTENYCMNGDMPEFKLSADFTATGDQPTAVSQLSKGISKGFGKQTLLGVTGSGKTFTMACIVEKIQKPTLVIAHNKTLAAQLATEFKEFFPENAANLEIGRAHV